MPCKKCFEPQDWSQLKPCYSNKDKVCFFFFADSLVGKRKTHKQNSRGNPGTILFIRFEGSLGSSAPHNNDKTTSLTSCFSP